MQYEPLNSNLEEKIAEKAAYHADLTQGYELEGDDNDISHLDPNERYD